MTQHEFNNHWALLQEMFGDFARPGQIAHVAELGYSESGRGAVFFYFAGQSRVCTYAAQEWICETIEANSFQQNLLKAIAAYNPDKEAIVLSTYDDIFLSPKLNYQWLSLAIISQK